MAPNKLRVTEVTAMCEQTDLEVANTTGLIEIPNLAGYVKMERWAKITDCPDDFQVRY